MRKIQINLKWLNSYESSAVIEKVLQTETGKFISKKLFGRIEKTLKSNSTQREVNQVLDSIAPIDSKMEQEVFEKISDRYLKFRTLLSRDSDVFIDEIYHPLRVEPIDKYSDSITLTETSSFEFSKIACIIGKAGQGKTTILRKLFLNYISNNKGQLPLIITLRKIDWQEQGLSPEKIISKEFEDIGITICEEACIYLLQLNRLIIFFDGYDEVDMEYRSQAIKIITQTYNKYGASSIVTTRPGTEIQLHGGEVRNYTLMDLNKGDVIEIVSNHTLISNQDKQQLLDVINSKEDIANILLTPIIVDIFISTYNSLIAEPKTIIDFYSQLFQILASSHDRLKVLFERKGKSELDNQNLEKVFQTASFILINNKNDINFRENELIDAFEHACTHLSIKSKDTYIDVIDKTSLIKQDGQDYSYLHKSIIEFFAAKHIKNSSDDYRKKYYKFIFNNYKSSHENILRYLSNIDNDLFYNTFAKFLVDKIKMLANINNVQSSKKLTPNLFLIGASISSINITVDKSNLDFKLNTDLSSRENSILVYFLMLYSILDIPLPVIDKDILIKLLNNFFDRRKRTIEGLETTKITHNSYSLKITDIIDVSMVTIQPLQINLDFSQIYATLI